jgi:hypothetical protein
MLVSFFSPNADMGAGHYSHCLSIEAKETFPAINEAKQKYRKMSFV